MNSEYIFDLAIQQILSKNYKEFKSTVRALFKYSNDIYHIKNIIVDVYETPIMIDCFTEVFIWAVRYYKPVVIRCIPVIVKLMPLHDFHSIVDVLVENDMSILIIKQIVSKDICMNFEKNILNYYNYSFNYSEDDHKEIIDYMHHNNIILFFSANYKSVPITVISKFAQNRKILKTMLCNDFLTESLQLCESGSPEYFWEFMCSYSNVWGFKIYSGNYKDVFIREAINRSIVDFMLYTRYSSLPRLPRLVLHKIRSFIVFE